MSGFVIQISMAGVFQLHTGGPELDSHTATIIMYFSVAQAADIAAL